MKAFVYGATIGTFERQLTSKMSSPRRRPARELGIC
jgi:hypothetical protein